MTKPIYIISILSVISISTIFVLYLISKKDIHRKNGFQRTFNEHSLSKLDELDILSTSYYISGLSTDRIYLGNHEAPTHMISLSYDLKDTIQTMLPVKYDNMVDWDAIKIQTDEPNLYLVERKTPSYISASMPFSNEQKNDTKELTFDLIRVLSPNSAIIRYYYSKQRVIQKITFSPKLERKAMYKPLRQQDGDFALDGFFLYNKEKGKIYYTFYYLNKFVCLDTNMKFIYNANTIDTNKIAKISYSEITRSNYKEKSMTKPPFFVNKRGSAHGNMIYINSDISADNEDKKKFQNYSVIDVYNDADGKYKYSFRLFNSQNKRIKDFAVHNDILVALYDHNIITFKIN